jgi:hypothetical protein
MTRLSALLSVTVACVALACSDSGSADPGAGGAGGGQGSAGTGGQGTAGGAGGAATAPSCPIAAPQAGGPCTNGQGCFYEDCAGAGRASARCLNGQWTLETGACAEYSCGFGAATCSPGQLCLRRQGGAQFFECVANNCGTSAISCGCLQSCVGDCYLSGSASAGFEIICNTCPQGLQCP